MDEVVKHGTGDQSAHGNWAHTAGYSTNNPFDKHPPVSDEQHQALLKLMKPEERAGYNLGVQQGKTGVKYKAQGATMGERKSHAYGHARGKFQAKQDKAFLAKDPVGAAMLLGKSADDYENVLKAVEERIALLNERIELIKAVSNIDLKPTESMANNARRGLELHNKFNRGGTSVGLGRARQLSSRETLSPDTVARMYSFFSRHEVDKQGKDWDNAESPSNGKIAWLLWGGDAGFAWATAKWKQIQNERGVAKASSVSVGDMVSWNSSGGTANGKVERIVREGSINVPKSQFSISAESGDPAVLIRIYKDGKETETLVGHKMSTLQKSFMKREFSQDQRDTLAESGKAMPDGSYPIATTGDLHNAIQAFGRAKDPSAVKAHIKRRAKALNAENMLPESWA